MTRSGCRWLRWVGAAAVVVAAGVTARDVGPDRLATTSDESDEVPGFDSPDRAMEWVLMAQRDEQGNIPRDGVMRARAQVDAMRVARDRSGRDPAAAGISRGGWAWIGPTNVGGRVRALVVHPTNTSTLITGGVSGGIWKSTNGGGSWRVIDDFMANLAVSSIVFHPGNPNVVLAATGEGVFNADAIRGAGIFISTDEGETWTQLPSTANVNFDFVNRLAFSADGNTLIAATRTGLFRSTDLGASWTQTLNQASMLDVKFIPGSNSQAVASGRNRNAFFSGNGGQSWVLAGGLAGIATERVELAVSRSAPNVVYASLEESNGQMWKSTDSGASYVKVSDSAHLSTQGWYDNALWVDPTNPDHVIAGGVSLFRSTNGGVSFTGISSCHVDQHGIINDPGYNGTTNRRVYFTSDGGVCKMEDVTLNVVTSLRNGLGITQFYAAAGHAGAGRFMGGTQDNGTQMYNTSAGSNVWASEFGSDGGFAAIDPTNPDILYGETQDFRLHRSLTGGAPAQYIYGGTGAQSCTKAVPYQITDACNGTANFISPFMLDPNEPNRLLAGGRSLWRSNDPRTANTTTTGPSWSAIKPPAASTSNISAIAVAPGNSDVIWVGHSNGDVYVTLNGTVGSPAWTKVDGLLPNRTITSFAIDLIDSQIVYVSLGGFSPDSLWRTTNGGVTWQDVTASGNTGLPDAPVRWVVQHPSIREWIYAATDVGVFTSENGGATWTLPHDGPANVAVFQLFWVDNTLVAVTHGRGLYLAQASSVLPSFAQRPHSQAIPPGHAVTFNVVATGAGPITYQWYLGQSGDTSNPIPGQTSGQFTTPPITQPVSYWVRITNPLGSSDSNTATLSLLAWSTLIPTVIDQGAGTTGAPLRATPARTTNAMAPVSSPAGNAAPATGSSNANTVGGPGVRWLTPSMGVGQPSPAAKAADGRPATYQTPEMMAQRVSSPTIPPAANVGGRIAPFSGPSDPTAVTAMPVSSSPVPRDVLREHAGANGGAGVSAKPAGPVDNPALPAGPTQGLNTNDPSNPSGAARRALRLLKRDRGDGQTAATAAAGARVEPELVFQPSAREVQAAARIRLLRISLVGLALVLPALIVRVLLRRRKSD